MGLRESRIIREVHPWLGVRLQWLQDVARIFGSRQTLISGNRTRQEQSILFDNQGDRPVASPGCSQHQYGFAADAQYLRTTHISSKGRIILLTQNETERFMQSAAHHVNLTTVNNDPGHLQIYPGAEFRTWAIARGFCDPPLPVARAVPRTRSSVEAVCGPGFATVRCNTLRGCVCSDPFNPFF